MRTTPFLLVFSTALLGLVPMYAAGKAHPADSTDRIVVAAHLPLSGAPVNQIISSTHWRRNFPYLDRGDGNPVAVVDVTHPSTPKLSGRLEVEKTEGVPAAVVGSAALLTSASRHPAPQTVSIMNYADPEHPQVTQRFSGVTAMLKNGSWIYLTNADGLWVLKMEPATDARLMQEYQQELFYNH